MGDIAIKVENLSKKYLIGHSQSRSLRETLSNAWHNTFGGNCTDVEEFWALRDVSFEIKQGEAVGIIGRNGAGKSTLLKLLSKITYPTSGKITMNGRVSSLLEVGTGFHPELTGRENIFLNGTILGMSRKEVKSKFDEIVDFSGVEKFLDTPVKRYSSGMYVRLAFAVAAHLEPEILIIDEVLAVGDAEFQKKCLGKMDEVAKGGRTVLFVSHNMEAINVLCNRSLLLNEGVIFYDGESSHVIKKYAENHLFNDKINLLDRIQIYNPCIKIESVSINNSKDSFIILSEVNNKIEIKIEGEILSDEKLSIEVRFYNENGSLLGLSVSGHINGKVSQTNKGKFVISECCIFPKEMTKMVLVAQIDITHPNVEVFASIFTAFKVQTKGILTLTGRVLEYPNSGVFILNN